MPKGTYIIPTPHNEPVKNYAPGSPERKELSEMLRHLRGREVDVPMYIGGKEVFTGKTGSLNPPHDHKHSLGNYHKGDKTHVTKAIEAALAAKKDWENFKGSRIDSRALQSEVKCCHNAWTI
jgi:1-pyrroline-5-carboxylate dehydrogenase